MKNLFNIKYFHYKLMDKIENKKTVLFFSLSITIITTIVLFTTLSLSQMAYSEDKLYDTNFGKFFGSPGLSIQQANSSVISEINSTTHLLQLNNVSDQTISLAEIPDRIIQVVSTFDIIENWSMLIGAYSTYGESPPNAALIFDKQGVQEIFIIELYNPIYDKDKKALNYDFTILDNSTLNDLPLDIGHSALIIDGIKQEGYPVISNS